MMPCVADLCLFSEFVTTENREACFRVTSQNPVVLTHKDVGCSGIYNISEKSEIASVSEHAGVVVAGTAAHAGYGLSSRLNITAVVRKGSYLMKQEDRRQTVNVAW